MDAYVGDVDILGRIIGQDAEVAELLESLGAPDIARAFVKEMAAAREVDPKAVAVRQQVLNKLGYQLGGHAATLFTAATATQVIPFSVVRPFRPSSAIWDPAQAPFFQLNSVEINGRNQLLGTGPVPLSAFAPDGVMAKFRWETINPSSAAQLSITMTNTAVDRTLRGGLFGASLMR